MHDRTFDAFYREHYLSVLRYVQRRLSSAETANEIAAECFVVAWKKFDPDDPFPLVWLYATARHLIGNAYRQREREQQLVQLLKDQPSVDLPQTEIEALSEAMSLLKEHDREALRLTYWEQLTATEVGLVLGCSEQAAWKRISRAKLAVRTSMAQWTREREVQ